MKSIQVAVGVILNQHNNVLIAKRHDAAHQGGLWEFPGGKVESGETAVDALHRELMEELGIVMTNSRPLTQISHDYGDKRVMLEVFVVDAFSGKPTGKEGQPVRWIPLAELKNVEFPAANGAIVDCLMKL